MLLQVVGNPLVGSSDVQHRVSGRGRLKASGGRADRPEAGAAASGASIIL